MSPAAWWLTGELCKPNSKHCILWKPYLCVSKQTQKSPLQHFITSLQFTSCLALSPQHLTTLTSYRDIYQEKSQLANMTLPPISGYPGLFVFLFAKFEFQINDKQFFSISMSQILMEHAYTNNNNNKKYSWFI